MKNERYSANIPSHLYGLDDNEPPEPPEPESRFGAWLSGFISGVVFTLFAVAIYQVLVTVRVLT